MLTIVSFCVVSVAGLLSQCAEQTHQTDKTLYDIAVSRHWGAPVYSLAKNGGLFATKGGVADSKVSIKSFELGHSASTTLDIGECFPTALLFSDDGKAMFGFDVNGEITVWDSKSAEITRKFTIKEFKTCAPLRVSPSGTLLALGQDRRLVIWDLAHQRVAASFDQPSFSYKVDFSGNSELVIAATSNFERESGAARIDTQVRLPNLEGASLKFQEQVTKVGKRLVFTGYPDWRLTQKQFIRQNHSILAVGSPSDRNKTFVGVWDATTGKLESRVELDGIDLEVHDLIEIPQSDLVCLVGCSARVVQADAPALIWNYVRHRPVARLVGHKGVLERVGYSTERQEIVARRLKGGAYAWDIKGVLRRGK